MLLFGIGLVHGFSDLGVQGDDPFQLILEPLALGAFINVPLFVLLHEMQHHLAVTNVNHLLGDNLREEQLSDEVHIAQDSLLLLDVVIPSLFVIHVLVLGFCLQDIFNAFKHVLDLR